MNKVLYVFYFALMFQYFYTQTLENTPENSIIYNAHHNVQEIELEDFAVEFDNRGAEESLNNLQKIADELAEQITQQIPKEEIDKCTSAIKNNIEILFKNNQNKLNSQITEAELKDAIEKIMVNKILTVAESRIKAASLILECSINQTPAQSKLKQIIAIISAKSVIKSITYRIWGTIISIINAYFFLSTSITEALALGALDMGTKFVGYYMHERAWDPEFYRFCKKYCCCCKKHR